MDREKKKALSQEGEPGQKKTGGKKWRIAVLCLVVVLGLAMGAGYGAFHHYFHLLGRVESSGPSGGAGEIPVTLPPEEEPESSLPPATAGEIEAIENGLLKNLEEMEAASGLYETDAFNILLIGVDARNDTMTGRSDAMILVSINKDTRKVTMSSFLRDIYVPIPGHGNNRLNAAYAFGGTELLTETIKANFGITVDRCLVVNFYLVMDLIDAVGGIDLDVTAEEIGVMNMYIRSHNEALGNGENIDMLSPGDAGFLHLDGNQALAYMRVRYVGTDFARTGRQRIVITKFLEKIKEMDLDGINGLAEAYLPRIYTDLSEGDCATLLLMLLQLGDYEIQSFTVPADGTWYYANIGGMDIITIDFSANAELWHEMVEG